MFQGPPLNLKESLLFAFLQTTGKALAHIRCRLSLDTISWLFMCMNLWAMSHGIHHSHSGNRPLYQIIQSSERQIPRAGFSCIQHSFMFLPEKPERGHHVFHVFLNCLVKESLYIYNIVIYSHFLDHLIFDLVWSTENSLRCSSVLSKTFQLVNIMLSSEFKHQHLNE